MLGNPIVKTFLVDQTQCACSYTEFVHSSYTEWVGDDHGSDHFIINVVFSYTPIYNKMNEKTVRLFYKADWIDINFSIRTTMTKTTLNKRNVTEDEIDNYVDTLTNTITSVIAEKIPTKSIKRNSMGLPIEIRELIRQKRHQRRLWQKTRVPQYKTNANRLQKRISKDITTRKRDSWKKYCDDMELSEGQDAAWCKTRSVLNPKSASYNYPALVSRGKGGMKTRSVTTSEKLDTFASQLEAVFTNEIENSVFDEVVMTDVDAELDQPFARARLTSRSYPLTPTRKHKDSLWPGPHHKQNHTLSSTYTSYHYPGLDQHLRLPRLSP